MVESPVFKNKKSDSEKNNIFLSKSYFNFFLNFKKTKEKLPELTFEDFKEIYKKKIDSEYKLEDSLDSSYKEC
jgi:hypothetical protein